MAFIGPRFAFLLVWIFGDRVDNAFSTWVWPLLGLLFFPWTTLSTSSPGDRSTASPAAGWVLVAFGVVLDLLTYSSRAAQSRYQSARA